MTLVFDASAVLDLLDRNDRGERLRRGLALREDGDEVTVAHLDAEVFSGLARKHRAGELDAKEVTVLLNRLSDMVLARIPITADLLEAAWELRHNSLLAMRCMLRWPRDSAHSDRRPTTA